MPESEEEATASEAGETEAVVVVEGRCWGGEVEAETVAGGGRAAAGRHLGVVICARSPEAFVVCGLRLPKILRGIDKTARNEL